MHSPTRYSVVKDRHDLIARPLTAHAVFDTGSRLLGIGDIEHGIAAWVGGADRDRTDDLRLAKPALSQLSYSPVSMVVGLGRFELPTSRLSGVRSNHLSYRPGRALGLNSIAKTGPQDRSLKTE